MTPSRQTHVNSRLDRLPNMVDLCALRRECDAFSFVRPSLTGLESTRKRTRALPTHWSVCSIVFSADTTSTVCRSSTSVFSLHTWFVSVTICLHTPNTISAEALSLFLGCDTDTLKLRYDISLFTYCFCMLTFVTVWEWYLLCFITKTTLNTSHYQYTSHCLYKRGM